MALNRYKSLPGVFECMESIDLIMNLVSSSFMAILNLYFFLIIVNTHLHMQVLGVER